ncbi:MAG: ATP-binding cassette domain-containing protein [Candidatus Bathyarchaeota archaeon]|jgi:ABC-2 type transport system ATP-binding protein
MSKESAIEVFGLTKRFGELVAVDHVAFEVKKGELFGFLGPNAAGKTTTIRMLTGVIKPNEGNARIFGYDILNEGLKSRQLMGIVPEMSNAYVDLSAWNNIMLTGELYGIPKKDRQARAEKLLRKVGLYQRKDHLVKTFSRGMKQKLLLCMALNNEPRILFLDEPTSGLDVESQRLIRGMIRELNEEGTTVFLTTHNMEEANQLCDNIAIINHGKIVTIDSPEKLKLRSSGLQSIEISFNKEVEVKELMEIQGINMVRKLGDKWRLYVRTPSEVIVKLVEFTKIRKMKIISMNTLTPTLEDVFLKLIKEKEKGKAYAE